MQNGFKIDDNDIIYKDVVIIGKYTKYFQTLFCDTINYLINERNTKIIME